MSTFTPGETAVRENLPVDVLRVCVQTHPVVFGFFTSFSNHFLPAIALAQLPAVPGLLGFRPTGQRRPEAAARGGGFHGRLLPPPRKAAPAGVEQRCGQVLRHRGVSSTTRGSRRWSVPIFRSQQGTGPGWCHPPVRPAWGCPRGGGTAPGAQNVPPYR